MDLTGAADPTGMVLGTEDATPLEFWVAIHPERYLQLDDVVALERRLPGHSAPVQVYGVVNQVRARHEGARFQSDVFLIEDGVLPAEVSEAARVLATRFEPEVFVPPLPGTPVRKAVGEERDRALSFDRMEKRLPIGLSREGEPFYANLEFLDGTRGAHANISGVSGVATKTTYATFLLYSLFMSRALGAEAINTKALFFNVKGEDLLFLDQPNARLDDTARGRYAQLGLPAGPFPSVEFWAPPRRDSPAAAPDVASRNEGVKSFFWTLREFCEEGLLQFLFADAEDERSQYPIVIQNVQARLKREAQPLGEGGVRIDGTDLRTFLDLVRFIETRVQAEDDDGWRGTAISQGTVRAFIVRLYAAVPRVQHLIRADVAGAEKHRIARQQQVTVVDIHNLHDRAQRFVVGAVLRKAFEEKETTGLAKPLLLIVLDELNKYAPREGSSPIKELLLDVAERGRSLGMILLGAQQTASEVERRVVANAALRVVGRLDGAEAGHGEYAFLPAVHRQRATILRPGAMIVSQPELPIPVVLEFPFPAWATRASEVEQRGRPSDGPEPAAADSFKGLL